MGRRGQRLWTVVAVGLGCGFMLAGGGSAAVGAAGALTVTVGGIAPGGVIPEEYAFCAPAKRSHVTYGGDTNPAISWSKGPAGTRSYAIIVYDPDVPSVFTDADQEGKTLPASLRRIDFYHFVLVDIPATVTELPAGADAHGVVPRGKKPGPTKYGVRGVNDYGSAFTGDPQMAGTYGGYDGPCPPWNDEIVHHYHFTVTALDVARLALSGDITGPQALKAMEGHVLAKGEVVGIYTTNPAVMKRLGITMEIK